MEDIQLLTTYVNNHKDEYPKGVYCKFIKLDSQWGIKCYRNVNTRNMALERQKKMSEYGYAPKVGIKFDTPNMYCYLTEVAQPIIESDKRYEDEYYVCVAEVTKENPKINDEITELCIKMRCAGLTYNDNHYANFGKIDGKLVCIDFS